MPDLNRSLLSQGENADTLGSLTDVTIATPEEFQNLVYDGTGWVNGYAPVVSYVQNAEANTLTTGTVVYLFGGTGDHASVKRADYTSDATSSKTIGLVGANIASSQNGPVITRGYVDGIDLSVGYSVGDVLWLGANGQFTTTKTIAPNHLVFIGVVVRATNNGIVYVATQNGYELDELHNVAISNTVASGEFLKFNGTIWVNDVIDLGTDTAGNYVAGITGTANEINVSGSGSEGASVTIGLPANVVIANNLTVTGDLTVNGNTTTLNTANLNVEDNFVLLNSGVTASPSLNAGLEVERGTSPNVAIRWNESTDKWEFTVDGTNYTELGAAPTTTSITTNTATTVASFALSAADSAEFTVKATQGGRRYSSKALALHNGTTVDLAQYGELSIAATETVAGTGAVTWTTRESNFGYYNIFSVAYGNNLWVAGGYYGQLRTSTDTVTWTTQTSNFPTNSTGTIFSLVYGNNLWVAGGYRGQLRTSTDAITWTTRTSNFPTNATGIIFSLAYGNSLWVAGGNTGEIRTSTDAVTWTTRTSNFGNTHIRSVAYGNSLWVAAGQSGQLRTSTDGITWTTQTSNFGNTTITSVAYGNSLWIAAGYYGQLRTSTDAITWTTRTSNFGYAHIQSVAYGNSLWVAAGDFSELRTSIDAITWTTQTSNFGYTRITSVAYGNNLWVAGGYDGQLHTSTATTVSAEIPLTLSADISGSDVRLRATITDAATTNAEVKVIQTAL